MPFRGAMMKNFSQIWPRIDDLDPPLIEDTPLSSPIMGAARKWPEKVY
jgi:hypothetical protein